MRRRLPGLLLAGAVGCGATASPRASTTLPGDQPMGPRSMGDAADSPATSRALEMVFTGQAEPSLSVKNGFPIAQHVFIDWQPRGVVAPGALLTFQVSVGTHTITCADSPDPDDHPAAVTESFVTGYAYRYEIHP